NCWAHSLHHLDRSYKITSCNVNREPLCVQSGFVRGYHLLDPLLSGYQPIYSRDLNASIWATGSLTVKNPVKLWH
ncbi:MAG: hypothetical protein WAO81_06505, partial [Methanosarcina flavescens]